MKRRLPTPVVTAVQHTVQHVNRTLPGRRVRWGNIADHAPFSKVYGWDRGLPVDRYFIERFIAGNADHIRGQVLEVRSALYTARFGRADGVTVLDVDPDNADADLVADLDVYGSLPAAAYDCVVLTQVLQYTDPQTALRNVRQSLRAGGCVLISVPCMGRVDPEAPDVDRRRWTPAGLQQLVDDAGLRGTAEGFGNAFLASAYMLGVAAEEIPAPWLDRTDSAFPIVACAVAKA
jgi:SAM-dependent methyltransferase